MPFSMRNLPSVVTVSGGEGSGSIALGVWLPREMGFVPMLTRADAPEEWLARWSRDGRREPIITEVEVVGPLLALRAWPRAIVSSPR